MFPVEVVVVVLSGQLARHAEFHRNLSSAQAVHVVTVVSHVLQLRLQA